MYQDGPNRVGKSLFQKSKHGMVFIIISCGVQRLGFGLVYVEEVFHNDPANGKPSGLNTSPQGLPKGN